VEAARGWAKAGKGKKERLCKRELIIAQGKNATGRKELTDGLRRERKEGGLYTFSL